MTMNPVATPSAYGNGSGYDQSRGGDYDDQRASGDEQMERVRDLILGDLRRSVEARLQTLETRLQTLEDKVEAARHEARADRQDHLAALAQGIDELGLHVRRLTRS